MKGNRGNKYIDAGRNRIKKNDRYGMSMGELEMLVNTVVDEDLYTAIGNAFYMGVEAGARMTERKVQ